MENLLFYESSITMNKIAIFLHFATQRKFCGCILSFPVTDIYGCAGAFHMEAQAIIALHTVFVCSSHSWHRHLAF
jgi:hypothetical protein